METQFTSEGSKDHVHYASVSASGAPHSTLGRNLDNINNASPSIEIERAAAMGSRNINVPLYILWKERLDSKLVRGGRRIGRGALVVTLSDRVKDNIERKDHENYLCDKKVYRDHVRFRNDVVTIHNQFNP